MYSVIDDYCPIRTNNINNDHYLNHYSILAIRSNLQCLENPGENMIIEKAYHLNKYKI